MNPGHTHTDTEFLGAQALPGFMLLGELEVSDINPRPEDSKLSVTVTGHSDPSYWKGPPRVTT